MGSYARIAASAAAAVAMSMGIGAASAQVSPQTVCGEREHLVQHLGRAYAEAPASVGLAATGNLVEVLTSEEGSWTILVTEPGGMTCVVAAGENWENVPRDAQVALGPPL